MKLLTNLEIENVSGAVINIGNGISVEISSFGIPAHAYNFIDTLENQVYNKQISTQEVAVKIFNAGYSDYFAIYSNHLANGQYTLHFS